MNKEFCINCGGKVEYSVTKPRFCPLCGVNFNTSIGASVSTQNNQDGGEPEYTGAKFDINKLRHSVAAQVDGNKISLDDLWKDPQQSSYSPRKASEDPEGNAILRQVMSECKSTKEPVEINV